MKTLKQTIPTEYELQATAFCESVSLEIEKHYTGHRVYFKDDKHQRAVWSITFRREGRQPYNFEYGASIANSYRVPYWIGYDRLTLSQVLKMKGADKLLESGGGEIQGIAELSPRNPKPPTDYDILSCIEKGSLCSYSEFCDNFGYDSDSIKARDTWQTIQEQAAAIEAMFTAKEITQLQEIC